MAFVRGGLASDRASMMLLQPSLDQLRLVAVAGRSLPLAAFVDPGHRNYAGRTLRIGEPVHLTTAAFDGVVADRRRTVRASLLVPFDTHLGAARGVMSLSRADDRTFTNAEISLAADWVSMLTTTTLERATLEIAPAPPVPV